MLYLKSEGHFRVPIAYLRKTARRQWRQRRPGRPRRQGPLRPECPLARLEAGLDRQCCFSSSLARAIAEANGLGFRFEKRNVVTPVVTERPNHPSSIEH